MASAADVITYVGIPLAVLGVLPIIYTCITSLITLRSIRQRLEADGVKPLSINSSLMSGIVEVCLPQFSITPLDRDHDSEYWKLSRRPSGLKGGSWTTFNWNSIVTGSRLYRLQYSDELRIPKAEIGFEELLSFLMDRGAVPDVKGLQMLRTSGLWTPTGTSLMLSSDTTHKVLRVALPDDSDGVLSLTLTWDAAWDHEGGEKGRPGWMSIEVPNSLSHVDEKKTIKEESRVPTEEKRDLELEKSATQELAEDGMAVDVSYEKSSFEAARLVENPSTSASLGIRFSSSGSGLAISDAIWKHDGKPPTPTSSLQQPTNFPSSSWIPSIAFALGLARSFPLYNHSLDPSLKILATRETIPCGVLVLLNIMQESDAPTWETKYDGQEDLRSHHSRFLAQSRAIAAEKMMSSDQARIARAKRAADESQQMTDQYLEKRRRDRERELQRRREAIASPRLDNVAVTNAALKWLIQQKCSKVGSSGQTIVETLIIESMKEDEQILVVCAVLEKWRNWNERGGMTIDDLDWLENKKQALCKAACVMSLLREVCSKEESTVAADMKACVEHWKKVRLG